MIVMITMHPDVLKKTEPCHLQMWAKDGLKPYKFLTTVQKQLEELIVGINKKN